MSKMPLDPIDVKESPSEYTASSKEAAAINVEPVSKQDLERLRQEAEQENNKRNLRVAHLLVAGLLTVIASSYLYSVILSAFQLEAKIPNEVLSVLQAALFTLLGYLFGDKNSKRKSN